MRPTLNSSDFQSSLWSSIKYDGVRDDLLRYYEACFHELAEEDFNALEQARYNLERASFPNNCFSYATGLIASGDTPVDPFYLKSVDLLNKGEQTSTISNKEYYAGFTPAIQDADSFKRALSSCHIKSLDELKPGEYQNYRPIIGLIADKDYHFVKVDLQNLGDEIRIVLSHRMTKIPASCNSLEQYTEGYNALYGSVYRHPQLLFSPKEFIGRKVSVKNMGKDMFTVTAAAA